MTAYPYFVVDMFGEMKDAQELSTRDRSPAKSSAQILVAVEGCGVVEAAGAEPVTVAKGDAVVVPASAEKFYGAAAVDALEPFCGRGFLVLRSPNRKTPNVMVKWKNLAKNSNFYPVILAGGRGAYRPSWPLSRKKACQTTVAGARRQAKR